MMRTTGSGQSLESQCNRHVRFTPKADMCGATSACPLCANSGHCPLNSQACVARLPQEQTTCLGR